MSRLVTTLAVALCLAFAATATAFVLPYQGTYLGQDQHHRTIHLSYRSPTVLNFSVNHHVILHQGHVSHGHFSTSQNGVHVSGHWVTDHLLEGTITASGHSVHYEAYAYST